MIRAAIILCVLALTGVGAFSYFSPSKPSASYNVATALAPDVQNELKNAEPIVEEQPFVATHVETPEAVKAIYMTSWVAATPSLRAKLVKIIDETEVNAVVIDIKDYTGKVSYVPTDPTLVELGVGEKRIADIQDFIAMLHEKDVYVIGRVAVFQDPFLVKLHPELAVKTASDKNAIWHDKKKITWIDAGAQVAWDHNIAIGLDAYAQGFDEINFDYIRFPSDGNMKDIYFPFSEGKVKHEVMKSFFAYVDEKMHAHDIPISVDLFGMVATNTDDLGIGQLLEDALPHFDFIAPMVYPSHFPPTWNGYKNPAANPYEVIKITMDKAGDRAEAMSLPRTKIRPWLQDFDMGAKYTAAMVRAQIKATYDSGLTSWMMWDAANTYTAGAFLAEAAVAAENVH